MRLWIKRGVLCARLRGMRPQGAGPRPPARARPPAPDGQSGPSGRQASAGPGRGRDRAGGVFRCLSLVCGLRRAPDAATARKRPALFYQSGPDRFGGGGGGGALPCKRPAVPEQSQRQKRQRAGNGEHVQRQRQTARTAGRLIPAPDNGGGRVALHGGAARVCGMVR